MMDVKPTTPKEKFELVERVKQKIHEYEHFYDDGLSIADFFKNYAIHKSFKRIENMAKY